MSMLDTAGDDQLPEPLRIFRGTGGGIVSWLNRNTSEDVISRLKNIENEPLSFEYLNQLLILSHEAGLSRGFFQYYWLSTPSSDHPHPYDVCALTNYSPQFMSSGGKIISVEHLAWGLERLYVDGLLFFGNIRDCYRALRNMSLSDLRLYFRKRCFDTDLLTGRGAPLPLKAIPRDNRYLVAEVACKTYDTPTLGDLCVFLKKRFVELKAQGVKRITARALLGMKEDGQQEMAEGAALQLPLPSFDANFSLTEILDEELHAETDIDANLGTIAEKFKSARESALQNTALYLSMIYDLDIYVATSMRTREDFRNMADRCAYIFEHNTVKKYTLRYFDPTVSAAQSHEDKGLIECLMVKCAKILVYMAGQKESYGKDAEAAMALSLGKPVIFLCDPNLRTSFYRDVHPLSRLIDFRTGVAVGAIVTDKPEDVPLLIDRFFANTMRYRLERKRENYFLLKEQQTGSVVRVQTDDKLLTETFWNYYHSNPHGLRSGE